jgi:hypothetical protein
MLRRISVIVASVAMLALSAMPAFAASHSVSKHKISFPSLHGVQAWGTYQETRRGLKLYVCTKDTGGSFAVGAVTLASNSNYKETVNFGAVALGSGATQCRGPVTLKLTSHLRVYEFVFGSNGKIQAKSSLKKIF